MAGGSNPRNTRRDTGYDVMQVCLNGHLITDCCEMMPDHMKSFCPDCGSNTITACPECKASIQGHLKGVLSIRQAPPRNNCHHCGTAYPWRQEALAAAIEAVQMELEGQDAADAVALIQAVSVESPRTEIAAIKLKKLLGKLSKPAYDLSIKVIGDVAAAAKSHFGA